MKDWQVVWKVRSAVSRGSDERADSAAFTYLKLTFVAIMIRDALVTLSHRHAIEAIDTVRNTLRHRVRAGVRADSSCTRSSASPSMPWLSRTSGLCSTRWSVFHCPAFGVFARD